MNLKMLNKGHVLVCGDIILDKYISGSVDRVSPEAPVPVLKPDREEIRLGGAGNVALNLSSLGSNATLIGVVGKDEPSTQIEDLLKKNKIKNALSKSNHPTITKLRILSSQQQLIRIDNEEVFSEMDWRSTLSSFRKFIKQKRNNVLIISDYDKGTLRNIPLMIKEAKKLGKIIMVDPKGDNFSKYRSSDIITPNFLEFERIVGKIKSENDLNKKGKALINDLKLTSLLITRGSEGMTLLDKRNKKIIREDFPTNAKDVFDVSGAGDTVIASIAAGLAGDLTLPDSIKLANIAAGIVVGKSGTASVSQSEIRPLWDKNPYVHIDEISSFTDKYKVQGKKIVFTNGCFDILHAGHVEYLQKARELGDILVVGLNSDRSVNKLKGKNRPYNTLEHRAKVLRSLSSVDIVVAFDDLTPIKLIKLINPSVLVKGGDYKASKIVGSKEVKKAGGKVVTIPLVEGLSTTRTIQKIS